MKCDNGDFNMIIKRTDLMVEQIEIEYVVFDPLAEDVKILNSTAYRILCLCDGILTEKQIIDLIIQEFCPDKEMENNVLLDVRECIEELLLLGLVENNE